MKTVRYEIVLKSQARHTRVNPVHHFESANDFLDEFDYQLALAEDLTNEKCVIRSVEYTTLPGLKPMDLAEAKKKLRKRQKAIRLGTRKVRL